MTDGWFNRTMKVGEHFLRVIGVFTNSSDHEIEKNSSDKDPVVQNDPKFSCNVDFIIPEKRKIIQYFRVLTLNPAGSCIPTTGKDRSGVRG